MLQSIYSHAGCDFMEAEVKQVIKVSIHTPTQGVTLESGLSFSLSKSFNPHTHVGCDLVLVDNVEMDINSFNPHTHVGCDLTAIYLKNKFLGFNPHTHVGCDIRDTIIPPPEVVSIHTPTQGVTRFYCRATCQILVSIHTPTEGVTRGFVVVC